MDRDDSAHSVCAKLIAEAQGDTLVPCTVVEETAYMVGHWLGAEAEAALAKSIADGGLPVEHMSADDWARVGDLVLEYEDLKLGSVDASIVAVAERLSITRLLTLDNRHFGVVRPRHCEAFDLLPG